MTENNKQRATSSALAGLEDILSGAQRAPTQLPTAKATPERPMSRFGIDVRALISGLDDETALLEPVALSGNSRDEERPVKSGLLKTDSYLAAYDPGTDTHSRITTNHSVKLMDMTETTGSLVSDAKVNRNCRGGHFIINVVSGAAIGNEVTPTIEAYDPIFNVWYAVLSGTAINSNGVNVLKIYPGISGVGDIRSDVLPKIFRLSMAKAGAAPVVYSASVNLVL